MTINTDTHRQFEFRGTAYEMTDRTIELISQVDKEIQAYIDSELREERD